MHLYNVNMWHAHKRSTFTQNKGKVIACCIAMSIRHDAVGEQCCWWFLGFSATDNNSYPSCLFLNFSVARDIADIFKSFAPLNLISMLSRYFTLQEASRERTIVTKKNHPLRPNDNKEIAVPGTPKKSLLATLKELYNWSTESWHALMRHWSWPTEILSVSNFTQKTDPIRQKTLLCKCFGLLRQVENPRWENTQ